MVSPQPDWDDVDHGYRYGGWEITVTEMQYSRWEDGELDEGTAYSVAIVGLIDGVADSHREIISFKKLRPAWEFANILTHYFVHYPFGVEGARTNLLHSEMPEEQWYPDGPVEDMSANEAFWKMATEYDMPSEVADLVDDPR